MRLTADCFLLNLSKYVMVGILLAENILFLQL